METDRQIRTEGRMDGYTDRRTDIRMKGRMRDRQIRTEGQMDPWTDGRID